MRARRDCAVKEDQGFAVIERADLGHEAGEEIERAIAFGDESASADRQSRPSASDRSTSDRPTASALSAVGSQVNVRW